MGKQTFIGSTTSHGGVIVSGSPDGFVNGIPISRLGDTHICPFHGPNTIVTCSPDTKTNNIGNARVFMDICGCGALIVSGSKDMDVNS